MKTRKKIETEKVNALLEQRYLHNKFLKEDEQLKSPQLQVTSIKGKPGKYKISIFQEDPNGNLKNIMTTNIAQQLNLMDEYASQEEAQNAMTNIDKSKLEKLVQ